MSDDLEGVIWYFMDAKTVHGYGPWVRAADYKALEAQLAEARADRDAAVAATLEAAANIAALWTTPAQRIYGNGGAPAVIRALIPQSGADALERARAVAVKPLVWENVGRCVGWSLDRESTHLHLARALGVLYEVGLGKDGWWARWHGECHATGLPSAEAAKAAAQADYEKRIRSALVHVTPDMLAQARADGMREAYEIVAEADSAELAVHGTTIRLATILAAIEKGEG